MATQTISAYLRTLISEKGREPDAVLNVEGHFGLTYNHLIEFIENQDQSIKSQIKDTLVKIDFQNGNVFHFLDHLVQGMIKSIES